MDLNQLYQEVKKFREKYNLLVTLTPSTGDKDAFKEAREEIKAGLHESDFQGNGKKSKTRTSTLT